MPMLTYITSMKDQIKYLIYKLFIYEEVDINNPLVMSCLTNIMLKYYPDFNKEEIKNIIQKVFEPFCYKENTPLSLTGFNNNLINYSDYNELYLAIKKSLIYSDSFEP